MANYHMASARNADVPLDGEKLLFAVDLVHFVMATRWSEYAALHRNISDSETYRDSVYNAFTGNIVKAIEEYTNRLRDSADVKFAEHVANNNAVTRESFADYIKEYEREYFLQEGETNIRNLFKYFVSVSLAAGHFHSKGVETARETAVNFVTLKLPKEYFMDSTYWDKMDAVASEVIGNINEEPAAEPVNLNLIDYIEH